MDITIPVPAVGILTLVSFLTPYAVAIVNRPWWSDTARKIVSVAGALVVAAVSMTLYYLLSGEPLPASTADWITLGLVAVGVSQASYALITKPSAAAVEKATSPE